MRTETRLMLQRIADIEKDRRVENNPGLYEEEEQNILSLIEEQDNNLPKLNDLIELNALKANYVLTEIQSGVVTKVKAAQIQLKKEAKNKLNNLIKDLGQLNNELEQTNDQARRECLKPKKPSNQSIIINSREKQKKLLISNK